MRTLIGHLDADTFYVSAERVRDPWLEGYPIAVLGNNGACVIAKSREMKKAGVTTGEPVWDAVKKCPEGVYRKRDFRWYEVLSRKMLGGVRARSACVEYHSIDEFFFTVPAVSPVPAADTARSLRDEVKAQTRLPVTVAIARTRTLAKLFVETVKPFGAIAITDPAEEQEILARLPVTEVAGIAGRRAARLAPYGVRSCLDLARMRRSLVRSLLTVTGERLWAELNGDPVLTLQPQRPPHQTIGRGGGIAATTDPSVVWGWAVRHLERLIEELDFHQVRTGKLTVWLSYRDGPTGVGEGTLDAATDRFDLLLDAARLALRQAWREGGAVIRVDLLATGLRGGRLIQRSLFEPPGEREVAVAKVKRECNEKLGRFTIRSGATLPLRGVYRDGANGYDICDVRGKLCF
jgi:nucleotidyltransferase/DNA polymerase involved in DNA repair